MKAGQVSALIVDGINPAYRGGRRRLQGRSRESVGVSTALFAERRRAVVRPSLKPPLARVLNDLQIDPNRVDLVSRPSSPCTTPPCGWSLAWAGRPWMPTFLRRTHNAAYTADAMYTDQNWNGVS